MVEVVARGAPSKLQVVFVKSILTAFGGAEHAAVGLACALRRRGHAVSFLTRAPLLREHPYFVELTRAGVDVSLFPRVQDNPALRALCAAARPLLLPAYLLYRRKRLGDAWSSVGSILWTLRARAERRLLGRRLRGLRRPGLRAIVHVFGPEGLTPWVAAWGRAEGVPVVYTETVEADTRAVGTFSLKWTIEAINEIPLVVCCGPRVARNVRENYGYRGEIAEIPFLVEDPRPGPGRPRSGAAVVVGIVGRLVEHKGHRELLWAVARLRDAGHAVELVVAGDGPLRRELETLATDLGLAACVRFTGRFESVADVMDAIDVLALPSSSEAQPLSITEAMAYAKPVVASDFGGIPDMVEDRASGLLVAPGDREALLQALRRLVTDAALRESMGQRGRTLYLESRSPSTVLEKMTRAYERLLEGRAA